MTISERGLQLIAVSEELRLHSYPDSAGVWTIGYGTTRIDGRPVVEGMEITREQAWMYLRTDCRACERDIERMVAAELTQNQYDALVSFVYNVGGAAFHSSTLLKHINAKLPVTRDLFTRWNKVHDPHTGTLKVLDGLTNRRIREFALYSAPL